MYVAIRDATLAHGGYQLLHQGLQILGLSAIELTLDRDLQVPSLTARERYFTLADPDQMEQLKDQMATCGVTVSGFLLASDFNAENLHHELVWVIKAVKTAHSMGIAAVRIDSIMSGERTLPLAERIARFSQSAQQVLQATDDTEVALGIENHGFQGNDPAFLDGVLERVNSFRLGVTMDTGNFYWAGHPLSRVYSILKHFAPMAKHTHVKNIHYPQEVREKQREMGWQYGQYVCPLEEGDIDLDKVVTILREAGYAGDLTIEDESLGRFDNDQRKAVLQKDAAYLKQLLG